MKKIITPILLAWVLQSYMPVAKNPVMQKLSIDTIPVLLPATFTDDYNIRYQVSDTLWLQKPNAYYHILRWNRAEQYLIAKNGMNNPSDQGLFTRIDYMQFKNMEPYLWGFCLTTYNAKTDSLAEFSVVKVDRLNPKKGCNGYPFSRMKRVE